MGFYFQRVREALPVRPAMGAIDAYAASVVCITAMARSGSASFVNPSQSQHWRGFAAFFPAAAAQIKAWRGFRGSCVHGLDQRRDVLRRRPRHDAVAEVEDVSGRGTGGMRGFSSPRARSVAGSVSSTSGSRLPCSATRSSNHATRCGNVDGPVEPDADAPIPAISASHAPPPLVNTMDGIAPPSRRRVQAGNDVAHRRQREPAVRVGGEQVRPRCRRSSRRRHRRRSAR